MNKVTSSINWDGVIELPNGLKLYTGTGNFSTTDTTVTIYHPFDRIIGGFVTPVSSAYSANDQLSLTLGTAANTVTQATDGVLTPVTARTAQVLRNSSGTSGLGFMIVLIGR